MIKQELHYQNLDGEDVTRTVYFHMNAPELIDFDRELKGGFEETAKRVTAGEISGFEIIDFFNKIISMSYGERVDGSGDEFFKSKELSDRFLSSLAYDELLNHLVSDPNFADTFVMGLLPKKLVERARGEQLKPGQPAFPTASNTISPVMQKAVEDSGLEHPYTQDGGLVPWLQRDPTQKEAMEMPKVQLQDVFKRKASGWNPSEIALENKIEDGTIIPSGWNPARI